MTGTGCNDACDVQRIETALYTGEHDVVVVAATVKEGNTLRGHVFGRLLYSNSEPFNVPFPASKEPSEATGAAVGPFDRIYAGGYRTFGGVPDAWTVHLHP